MNTNLKDKITNVCSIVMAFAGIVFTIKEAGVTIPQIVSDISVTMGIVAGAVIGYFTGKNPDGTSKKSPNNV